MPKRVNRITAATDVGSVRDHNEDSHMVNPERMCFAVADGVAGAPYGEIASSLVTRCAFMASKQPGLTATQTVKLAFKMAADRLAKEDHTKYHGMMTTMVVLCIDEGSKKAVWGHVGDSRLYVRHRLKKLLLTKDHQDSHGRLCRVLSTGVSHSPTIGEMKISSDDVFILCTDGVSNELNDDQIFRSSQFTAQTLVRRAVMAGGRDNATGIIVKMLADANT